MISLLINKKVVARLQNDSFNIDFSVKKARDVGSIFTINSIPFTLPFVGELAKILGNIDSLISANEIDLNKRISASLIMANGAQLDNGYLQVKKIIINKNKGNKIEVIYFGSQADLKALFGSIKLADIYKTETRPYRITTEIKLFYDNPTSFLNTNGIAYPIIDYSQNFTGNTPAENQRSINEPLTQLDFKPALTWHKILTDGFNYFGLSYLQPSGEVLEILKKTVMPFHNNESNTALLDVNPNENNCTILNTSNFAAGGAFAKVPFNNAVFDPNNNFNTTLFFYEPVINNANYLLQATLNFETQIDDTQFEVEFFAEIFIERILGNVSFSLNSTGTGGFGGIGNLINLTLESEPISINLLSTDKVFLRVRAQGTNVINSVLLSNSAFRVVGSPNLGSNSLIVLGRNAPDLTFFDFYQSVLTKFCGVPQFENGNFFITPYNEWIESGTKIQPLIDETTIEVMPAASVNSYKSIRFTDQEDNDYLNVLYKDTFNEAFGTSLISDTGNEFTTAELIIDTKFAATPIRFIQGSNILAPQFINLEGKGVRVKPRFMYYQGIRAVGIKLKDLFSSPILNYTTIAQFGHYSDTFGGYASPRFDLNFGSSPTFFTTNPAPRDNVFFKYWQRYVRELFSPKAKFIKGKILTDIFETVNKKFNEANYYKGINLAIEEIRAVPTTGKALCEFDAYKLQPFEPVTVAPLFPVDIQNNIVEWVDVLTNQAAPNPSAQLLEPSCNAYGFTYDSVNNVCIFTRNLA